MHFSLGAFSATLLSLHKSHSILLCVLIPLLASPPFQYSSCAFCPASLITMPSRAAAPFSAKMCGTFSWTRHRLAHYASWWWGPPVFSQVCSPYTLLSFFFAFHSKCRAATRLAIFAPSSLYFVVPTFLRLSFWLLQQVFSMHILPRMLAALRGWTALSLCLPFVTPYFLFHPTDCA